MSRRRVVAEDGKWYIPPSQRSDGTWRPAVQVKPGYIPSEELPKYVCKGRREADERSRYPVGLPDELKSTNSKPMNTQRQSLSSIMEKIEKQKFNSGVSEMPLPPSPKTEDLDAMKKKLKNLRKKLRDVHALERKIQSGELTKIEKTQKQKLEMRSTFEDQIKQLERDIGGSAGAVGNLLII
ncbi:mago binding family protein [Trichinella spiralis]|uniref:mago binding family protein n=1 Tax=Trichinella spiralis TaxID=6334 RepID=UPI0001EFC089|nr:mago binding family protein [Trichinella spiralis]